MCYFLKTPLNVIKRHVFNVAFIPPKREEFIYYAKKPLTLLDYCQLSVCVRICNATHNKTCSSAFTMNDYHLACT